MSPISSYLQAGAGWQWLGTGCILHPDQATSPCHQERATASSPTRPKGSLRLPPPGLLWCWISPSRSPPSHPFVSPRSGSGSISALEIVAAPCPGLFPACTKHHALSLAALGCFLPKIHPPPPPALLGHRGCVWEHGATEVPAVSHATSGTAGWWWDAVAGPSGGDTHPDTSQLKSRARFIPDNHRLVAKPRPLLPPAVGRVCWGPGCEEMRISPCVQPHGQAGWLPECRRSNIYYLLPSPRVPGQALPWRRPRFLCGFSMDGDTSADTSRCPAAIQHSPAARPSPPRAPSFHTRLPRTPTSKRKTKEEGESQRRHKSFCNKR